MRGSRSKFSAPPAKQNGSLNLELTLRSENLSGADEISNVGGDCQSSNLANPGAIKFARDYDKEPLILKIMLCMRCLSCRPSRLFLRSSFILFSAIMNTHSRHALYSHQIYITLLIFSNLKTVARSNSQAQPCDTSLQVKSKIHSHQSRRKFYFSAATATNLTRPKTAFARKFIYTAV